MVYTYVLILTMMSSTYPIQIPMSDEKVCEQSKIEARKDIGVRTAICLRTSNGYLEKGK